MGCACCRKRHTGCCAEQVFSQAAVLDLHGKTKTLLCKVPHRRRWQVHTSHILRQAKPGLASMTLKLAKQAAQPQQDLLLVRARAQKLRRRMALRVQTCRAQACLAQSMRALQHARNGVLGCLLHPRAVR